MKVHPKNRPMSFGQLAVPDRGRLRIVRAQLTPDGLRALENSVQIPSKPPTSAPRKR